MKSTKHLAVAAALLVLVGGGFVFAWDQPTAGRKLDEFRGVAVYDNGPLVATSHGKHDAGDGYYYGQKWQCVEFVKRFLHQAYGHRMPDVWGHAKDFFDAEVAQGKTNSNRGLLQYRNGGNVAPLPGDLVVFTNGFYGHVAIISAVRSNRVEVIQQNIFGHPRDTFTLTLRKGVHRVGEEYAPAGWLRVPPMNRPRQLSR